MNSTLRTRLLLGISVTIVVTLCATHYGMFVLMRQQLLAEFDQSLAAKVRALSVLVEQQDDQVAVEFQQHPMQEFARSIRPEYYQLWHEDGTVLARSRQLGDNNLTQLNGDRVVPQITPILLPDGRSGRAAGIRFRPNMEGDLPVAAADHGRGQGKDDDDDVLDLDEIDYSTRPFVTLVVARDTQDLATSLAGLSLLLAGSGVLSASVILAVLAWLVTKNLRPLLDLAGQISKVNEQSLDQRFVLANAPGELTPIVSRLNGLMTCLETAFLREKTFTADVAHELRTPLAGIRSTLEVSLSRQRESESYRSSMKKCLAISEYTETIVSTLLSLSRIEAGQAVLETDIVDLTLLVQRAWRPFSQAAVSNEVSVTWNLNDQLLLRTDSGKLQLVVSNLLGNATSYVNHAGQITVSAFIDDNTDFCLTIANSGCQLTPDEVELACDRFWRGDKARSATGVHSGLGLALARRTMQFLNGRLQIHVGGDQFVATVRLPASTVEHLDTTAESQHAIAT
ncbi:MAG: ATP-binding protein [Fuerstiella sp.]